MSEDIGWMQMWDALKSRLQERTSWGRTQILDEMHSIESGKLREMTSRGNLLHEEIVIACRNIGIDLSCGGCASAFYTGVSAPHDENCTRGSV